MTNNQTIVIVIVLVAYFIGLGFFLNAMGEDIPLETKGDTLQFCKKVNVLTMTCTEQTFIGNVIISIDSLPAFANAMFIVIPFILLVLFIVLLFVHG